MKKLFVFLFAAAMITIALVLTAHGAANATYGYQLADVNDDGFNNAVDLHVTLKAVVDGYTAKDLTVIAADLDTDGEVTLLDARLIRRVIAGIDTVPTNNANNSKKVTYLTIGGNNIARYSILIPANADKCTKTSSDDLKSSISSACGISLNKITSRSATDGFVIEYRLDTEGTMDLGADGYKVVVQEDGDVILYCGMPRGPLYVTYYFLEQFVGYRYLNDGATRGYLYQNRFMDTPIGYEDTEVPQFEYRALNQVGTNTTNFKWLRLNGVDAEGSGAAGNISNAPKYGGGVGNLYIHGHSYEYQEAVGLKLDELGITDLDSAEAMQVFSDYAYNTALHNEYNTEHGLSSSQPCLTSDVTFRHVMAFNYLLYKERTINGRYVPGVNYTMFSVSPNDNTAFCTCTNCKKIYEREGSLSGTVFLMSNRASEAMKEIDPAVGIYTIAYWDARNPPRYTRPSDDVCVCFCVGGCNNHTYDHPEECAAAGGNPRLPQNYYESYNQYGVNYTSRPSTNVDEMEFLDRWSQLTNNIYIWYYACNFSYYISPSPNVFNIYNDFRHLATLGVRGMYCEGSSIGDSFERLRGYLAARMMWDPYMSEEEFEKHIDEFLMIYYGNGWEYIKEYLYIQNRAGDLKGCWTNNFDWPWDMYDKSYYATQFDHIMDLFDSAYAATSDTTQKDRIERLSIHARFLGLSATYESNYVNGTPAQKSAYTTRYTWLWNYMKTKAYLQRTRDNGFKSTSFQNGPGGLNCLPTSSSDVRDTMSWIFNDGFTGQR